MAPLAGPGPAAGVVMEHVYDRRVCPRGLNVLTNTTAAGSARTAAAGSPVPSLSSRTLWARRHACRQAMSARPPLQRGGPRRVVPAHALQCGVLLHATTSRVLERLE